MTKSRGEHPKRRNLVHKVFEAGVVLKGVDGVLELIGGLLLYFVSSSAINKTILDLTQGELAEDPNDVVANTFLHFAHSISSNTKMFGALYLFSHGLIKMGLVVGLLKKKRWAYPTSIVFLFLFILYQLYRLMLSFTIGMLLLAILDILLVWLVWREYQSVKADQNF